MDTEERHKIQEEIDYLYERYYEMDKEFEKAKGRRLLFAILGFAFVYAYLLWSIRRPDNFLGLLMILIFSVVLSGIHVFINLSIFGSISDKGHEEYETLEHIRNRISDLKKKL